MTGPVGNVSDVRPAGEPVIVHEVLIAGALTEGPEIMAVLGNPLGAVVVQWETTAEAERDLSAMLADVQSRMPLPPVVELVPR